MSSLSRRETDRPSIERRTIVSFALGAITTLALGRPDRAWSCSKELAWERFIQHVLPLAKNVVSETPPDEEGYLRELDALLAQLCDTPPVDFTASAPVDSAHSFNEFPFAAVQFRLAPWATIPCHDHRHYNGIFRVMDGSIRLRTFETVGDVDLDSKDVFKIREIDDRVLRPGDRSSLSRTRHNIHTIQALDHGARLVDLFTFFREDGKSVPLDVDVKGCGSCEPRVFAARWKG